MAIEYDSDLFKDVKAHADYLVNVYTKRDAQNQLSDDMFMCRWSQADAFHAKMKHEPVISIDPRVKALGVIRIMNAGEAQFSIQEEDQRKNAKWDELVRAARLTWKASSKARGRPLQKDLITTGVLHAEYVVTIDCVSELVKELERKLGTAGSKSEEMALKIEHQRLKLVAACSPYVFDVLHPNQAYTDRDQFGMKAFLRRIRVSKKELIAAFGAAAVEMLSKDDILYEAKYVLNDYYNYIYRVCWLDNKDHPLLCIPHELPFIPVVSHLVEGGGVFDTVEDQRQGFLYSTQKSGLWGLDNLTLSMIYANTFKYGGRPKFLYEATENYPDATPVQNWEEGQVEIPAGSKYSPLDFKVIPDELLAARSIAEQKITESTVYSQIMGAPPPGDPSYSLVALYNQTGRQVLTPYISSCGYVMAEAAKKALLWQKHVGGRRKYKVQYEQETAELKPSEIPDDFVLDCTFELGLPQDKAGQSQIAMNLITANFLSRNFVREEVMGVEDSDAMEEEIMAEKTFDALVIAYITQKVQAMMQPAMPAQAPAGGGMNAASVSQMAGAGPPGVQGAEQMIPKDGSMEPMMPMMGAGGGVPVGEELL